MELPKYIKNKIQQLNNHVYKARGLEVELEAWCEKAGIDIYSDEFREVKSPVSDAVGSIDENGLSKLYKR